MYLLDVIIILVLISGFAVGFKRGFSRELVSSVGFILVLVLSFILKNPVSIFLYENLPFFKFAGIIKGVTALNIALYEVFAFIIVLSLLTLALKLLIQFTNIFESLLKVTIVLAPISKIAGGIVGVIESYAWVFIILYILAMPMVNIPILKDSNYRDKILNNTPVLSGLVDKSLDVIKDFTVLKEKYQVTPNASEFNRETLDLFLKYKVISVESVETLVKKDKLKIDNVNSLLKKYRDN